MSSTYTIGKKVFWQWKYAAIKSLKEIAHLRDLKNRFHYDKDCRYDSDKHCIEALRDAIKRYWLFLEERDNPMEVK